MSTQRKKKCRNCGDKFSTPNFYRGCCSIGCRLARKVGFQFLRESEKVMKSLKAMRGL